MIFFLFSSSNRSVLHSIGDECTSDNALISSVYDKEQFNSPTLTGYAAKPR